MKPLSVLLLLVLCAQPGFSKTPGVKDDGFATLHIYRNSSIEAMLMANRISVNGKKIKVKNGRSYEMKIPAGATVLKVRSLFHSSTTVNAEAGKDYYFRSLLRAGAIINVPELIEVTPDFAEGEMSRIKPKHRKTIE